MLGDRLRNAGSLRSDIRRKLSALHRARFPILIATCCLTLLLLGIVQLSWIGQISDSRRREAVGSLERSIDAFTRHLRSDAYELLTIFKADASSERAGRLEHYLERLWSWHDLSTHGPAVKRVMFYDFEGPGGGELTELMPKTRSIERATWGDGMEGVRRNIQEAGFRAGQAVTGGSLATWMCDPATMTLWRPMSEFSASSRSGLAGATVTGYLILQLDLPFIREELLPELLNDHFVGPTGDANYEVALTVDGRCLYAYFPSGEGDPRNSDGYAYSLSALDRRKGACWPGEPDSTRRLLLSLDSPPKAAEQRGGVQPIALQWRTDRFESHSASKLHSGPIMATEAMADAGGRPLPANLAFFSERPRAFLVSAMPRELELVARHVGIPLEAVLNSEYRRTVAFGSALLLLVAGALAVVAISARVALRRADLQMEAVANVSHEFRTPLAVIGVIGHNLSQGPHGSGQKAIEYGKLLKEHGRRLSQMVDQTLQLSAIESGDKTYRIADVDVWKVTQEALNDIKPMIDEAGFELECARQRDLPAAQADEEALRQSLGNLLSNAVKYGQPGCWVKLEILEAGGGRKREVQIRVHDRGQGIPARSRTKVFDPYYRVPSDRVSPIPGSGLGLKLTRDMIGGMGGALTLESEQGRGSVFTIHLPVAD